MRQLILKPSALQHNFHQVRALAPTSKILCMVKANAYGHGLAWAVDQLLKVGADGFGVAVLEEAEIVRALDAKVKIFLMDGFLNEVELKRAIALNLCLVIHQPKHLSLLEAAHFENLEVWLKVDTGMHRLGFPPSQIPDIYAKLQRLPGISHLGLMTHFAEADDLESPVTQTQINVFEKVEEALGQGSSASLANSAGILAWPKSHRDWVRPGIMLYGASPFGLPDARLKPVMTVRSEVIALNQFSEGDALGYGGTFVCPKPMRVATVAFGYGDGYPRSASGSEVWIAGKHCKAIARVSMDMIQVDVSELPNLSLGEPVTLWGDDCPVELLAKAAATISYEIFCRMPRSRFQRLCGN